MTPFVSVGSAARITAATPATIAADADVRYPLRQLIHPDGDRLTFIWRDRSGEIMQRRLPADLTAYSRWVELRRIVCPLAEPETD